MREGGEKSARILNPPPVAAVILNGCSAEWRVLARPEGVSDAHVSLFVPGSVNRWCLRAARAGSRRSAHQEGTPRLAEQPQADCAGDYQLPPVRKPAQGKDGETFYQVFSGEGALFGPKQTPKYPTSIPDGTSNTVLVVEAGSPVIWSKPADVAFDQKKALPKLGGLFGGEFHVALCDGSVMRIKKDFDEAEMKNLIMPADGNVIDIDKLKK
jgi:hypothetical protein